MAVDMCPDNTNLLIETDSKLAIGLLIRLPETHQEMWVLVVSNDLEDRTLTLLTNVPLLSEAAIIQVYQDWRLCSRIEHSYRFDQEQGLGIEDLRVQTLERMRRLFAIVLVAAQFIFHPIQCCGYANWAANWASNPTGMALTSSCVASARYC